MSLKIDILTGIVGAYLAKYKKSDYHQLTYNKKANVYFQLSQYPSKYVIQKRFTTVYNYFIHMLCRLGDKHLDKI